MELISKHNDDKQYVSDSQVDGAFVVSKDTENEPLGHGTKIRLQLEDEEGEYLDENKLKDPMKKYYKFTVNFPIYI